MNPAPTPSGSNDLAEALSPDGENLAFLSPELSTFMDDLRAKVNAARSWPVAGQYVRGYHRKFHRFSSLPSEIRGRIYELACYQPRTLEITCHEKPICDTPVPALLHASSESRKYALKIYESLVLDSVNTGTYVNWDLDTIFINDRRASYNRNMDYNILHEKCKRLAMPSAPFSSFHFPAEYTKVESLILVLNVMSGEGKVEFVPSTCDEEGVTRPKADLTNLWMRKRIRSYQIRDVIRGNDRAIFDPKQKFLSQERREKERKSIEPLRSDEDVAIRLQYDLDHGYL